MAEDEAQALELGSKMLEDMDEEEFNEQVVRQVQTDGDVECYEN